MKEAGRSICLSLQDKVDEFLEAEPFDEEPPKESGDEEGDSEHDESTNIGKLHEAMVSRKKKIQPCRDMW